MFILKILPAVVRNCYLHSSNYYRIPAGGIFARIIQRAYRKYRKRPASLVKCDWGALRYDPTHGVEMDKDYLLNDQKKRFQMRLGRPASAFF
jgi:hypothetical protein